MPKNDKPYRSSSQKSGSVAIFSQGPVGMMATVGARLRGAGLVIGVESMPNRIALAKKYGCDVIVDFTKEDPIETILKITGGKGVDSAIESLGSAKTFAACVSVTRPGGTISNIGYHGDGDSGRNPYFGTIGGATEIGRRFHVSGV